MPRTLNLFSDESVEELYAMLRWWRKFFPPARGRAGAAGGRSPATRRPFELTAPLLAGGTAAAVFLRWDASANGGAGDYVITSETLTVSDPLGRAAGVSGDKGLAQAIQADNGVVWEAILCPGQIEAQTVVTDFRVNGNTLQIKTRSVRVIPAGAESGWTTKHTGTTCP
jgi:hypothetical protein